jgi:hypothetical protein
MRFSERRYCGILSRAACVPACAVIDDSAAGYAPGMLSDASGLPLRHRRIISQAAWICKAHKYANIGRFHDFSKDGMCDILGKYRGCIRAAFPVAAWESAQKWAGSFFVQMLTPLLFRWWRGMGVGEAFVFCV